MAKDGSTHQGGGKKEEGDLGTGKVVVVQTGSERGRMNGKLVVKGVNPFV